MNPEAVLMSAYAFATQERYGEAEKLLASCPEAIKSVQGQDLLARIRLAEGKIDEARSIWERILVIDSSYSQASTALQALDHPVQDGGQNKGRIAIAIAIALVAGIFIWSLGRGCRSEISGPCPRPQTVYVTNDVIRVQTNEVVRTETKVVDRPIDRFVDRYFTNVVEKVVEVPVTTVVTSEVERVVERIVVVTNTIPERIVEIKSIPQTNEVSVFQIPNTLGTRDGEQQAVLDVSPETPTESAAKARLVYNPSYIIKQGDQVGHLAQKYHFRLADFRALNPGVNENVVVPGQKILIPGFYSEDDLPR